MWGQPRRVPRSGALEIAAPNLRVAALGDLRDEISWNIRSILEEEDDRRIDEFRFPDEFVAQTGGVIATTRIATPDGEVMPVLGPGGRVVFHETADGLQFDIVVRRRGKWLESRWRRPDRLAGALLDGLGLGAEDQPFAKINATLGYFELSKYEAQRVIRPVFLAVADVFLEAVAVRSVTAVAATTGINIELSEGLGAWSTPEDSNG
jgi:hypothetical protein